MTDVSTWLPAALAAFSAIAVAYIGYLTSRNQKKQNENQQKQSEMIKQIADSAVKERKDVEERAEARRKESLLSMELMNATCKLCMITAKKLTDQKLNGDVKEAMDAAGEAQRNYDAFIRRVACKVVST